MILQLYVENMIAPPCAPETDPAKTPERPRIHFTPCNRRAAYDLAWDGSQGSRPEIFCGGRAGAREGRPHSSSRLSALRGDGLSGRQLRRHGIPVSLHYGGKVNHRDLIGEYAGGDLRLGQDGPALQI